MSNIGRMFALTLLAATSILPALAATTNPRVDTSGVNAQPPYPASALPDRESGAILLAVGVDTDGNVTKIRPVRTSGFDDLDAAAINGAMKWKFIPATENGKAVEGSTLIQIVFQPPADNSTKPDKLGVPADFLSQDIKLEAKQGHYSDVVKAIPCANGSVSATLRFTDSHSGRFDKWYPVILLSVGDNDDNAVAMIQTYPSYDPPLWQYVEFVQADKQSSRGLAEFRVYPQFRTPTNVRLSWTDYGLVTGTAGNGDDHQIRLPAQPRRIRLSVSSAAGEITNAQLFCMPSK